MGDKQPLNLSLRRSKFLQILPHHLLMNVSDAVIACDMDFLITSWNPAAEQIYGWKQAEVLGKPISEVLGSTSNEVERAAQYSTLVSDGTWRGESTHHHRNGNLIYIDSTVSLIKTETGEIMGLVGINRDISLQKQIAKEHQALLEEKRRSALLRRFLGNTRHDLITPITSLKTGLFLLQKTALDEKGERYVQRMGDQVDKLYHLLGSMLTMLDLDEISPSQLSLEDRDINQIIMEVVEELNCPQQIQLELSAQLPKLYVDYSHVKRAILEILENAVIHTPAHGQICLRSHLHESAIVIEIQDTGTGIAPTDHERIFQLFFRVDTARNTDQGGMGLGLSLVKKVMEYHNGRVEVHSDLGQGSTFRLIFPLNDSQNARSMLIKP